MPERLVIESSGEVLGEPVRRARSHIERARGLLGTEPGAQGPLILERARQVHTFGMTYPIDVIFCDARLRVVHVVVAMRPRRITKWVRAARLTIELPASARALRVRPGDVLRLEAY